jgi:1-acyl-sn-glycerol-3-phosphate acyltransferase
VYVVVRTLASALLRTWFRLRVSGIEHLPRASAAVVAANHKSFLDAFFIGLATDRRIRIMAKVELFRWPLGPLLLRLGVFPVRRGEADAEALETAGQILTDGGVLVVFPEGTRVDEPDALGSPHHGAGRLALASGAPIVPVAISGTSHLWVGPVPKPRRVDVSFLPAVAPDGAEETRAALEDLIDRRVWPAVQLEYGRLRATPGAIAAALAALGLGGLAARRGRREVPRLLGVIEPRKLRRRRRRRALLQALRPRRSATSRRRSRRGGGRPRGRRSGSAARAWSCAQWRPRRASGGCAGSARPARG